MIISELMDIASSGEKIPAFPKTDMYPADYLLLLGALDIGWNVEQPIRKLIAVEAGRPSEYLIKLIHIQHIQPKYLKIQGNKSFDTIITDERWRVIPYIPEEYLNLPAYHL